jgi:hypothetical protein
MTPKRVKISQIKPNPSNPRTIRDDKFRKLVQSLKDFPEMMELRPVVLNRDMVILGGNMRFKASQEAGWKEIPAIIAENLTPEQEREFIIKDNTSGGDWDWEMLAMEWDADKLEEWGLDLPKFAEGHDANNMNEDNLDLDEDYDPIGTDSQFQKIVFVFDGKEEAESWLKNVNISEYKKHKMIWEVNLSTRSI